MDGTMSIIKKLKKLNWRRIEALRKAHLLYLKARYKPQRMSIDGEKLDNCRKIFVFMGNSGFGDAIVISGMLRALKDKGFIITVLAQKRLETLFADSQLVDRLLLAESRKDLTADYFNKVDRMAAYDFLIDFCQGPFLKDNLTLLNLYRIFQPRYLVGFNDIFDIFDISLRYDIKREHFTRRFGAFFAVLGITGYDIKYTIEIPQFYQEETRAFLAAFTGERIVCFNPFASEKNRNFSVEQIQKITGHLSKCPKTRVIIVGEPYQLKWLDNISLPENTVINRLSNFFNAAYIVQKADLIISTDTSIVHLAKAYDKKLICVYNNRILADGACNNIVWAPGYAKALQLFTKGKAKSLYGDPVSDFNIEEINSQIDKILKKSEVIV